MSEGRGRWRLELARASVSAIRGGDGVALIFRFVSNRALQPATPRNRWADWKIQAFELIGYAGHCRHTESKSQKPDGWNGVPGSPSPRRTNGIVHLCSMASAWPANGSMQYSVVEWHLVLIYVTSQLLLMQSCLMFWYSIAMIWWCAVFFGASPSDGFYNSLSL